MCDAGSACAINKTDNQTCGFGGGGWQMGGGGGVICSNCRPPSLLDLKVVIGREPNQLGGKKMLLTFVP